MLQVSEEEEPNPELEPLTAVEELSEEVETILVEIAILEEDEELEPKLSTFKGKLDIRIEDETKMVFKFEDEQRKERWREPSVKLSKADKSSMMAKFGVPQTPSQPPQTDLPQPPHELLPKLLREMPPPYEPPPEPPDLYMYMKEGGSTKTLSPAPLEPSESLLKPSDPCLSTMTGPTKLPPSKPSDLCPPTAIDTAKLPPSELPDRNACLAGVGPCMVELLLPPTVVEFRPSKLPPFDPSVLPPLSVPPSHGMVECPLPLAAETIRGNEKCMKERTEKELQNYAILT